MPIVFVHGVNNRKEDTDYAEGVARIDSYLKEIMAPRLDLNPKKVSTFFPYWGGHGVKFRWNQASLPSSSDAVQTLSLKPIGPGSSDLEMLIGEARFKYGKAGVNFGEISRKNGFEEAVDLVWDTASVISEPSKGYTDVIEAYGASLTYAKEHPAPLWALQSKPLTNEEFLKTLLQEINPYLPEKPQSLGISDWFQSFKEAVNRLGSAPSDAATSLLLGLSRKSVHEKASRFLGDIFVYLSERGTVDEPGLIVNDVLSALQKAQEAKRPGDDKLVVIGHSLGGVILYDILTYFKPDIKIDVLVSVGSQIALFEEMTLYKTSKVSIPPNPPQDRLSQPDSIAEWLNVFDTNDIFSFRAQGVFEGPTDYRFDTGYGLLQAHGGYFARPSFYKRLAARLQKN